MGATRELREEVLWDLHENPSPSTEVEVVLNGEVSPELFGIEPVKATGMISGLSTTLAEREALKASYVDVINLPITADNISVFKELRLKIVKNRTQGLDKWKEKEKAFYLAGGNFIQAVYNKELRVNQDMESKLLEAEKHFENLEKERLNTLRLEREALLQPFVEVLPNDLHSLDADVFDAFLETKKKAHTDKIAAERAEAERIEAERIEREKQIEAQRLENERLKKEAEEREKAAEAERKKQADILAKEREAAEKKLAEERAKAKAEADKLAAIEAAKLEAERKERVRIEAELQAKKDAENKAEAERKDAEEKARKEAEKAAKAPVKKQLSVWVDSFELPSTSVDNETSQEIKAKFTAFKNWASGQINNL